MDALNGKKAVVTGGAQGLGLAIAASLGRTGARIVLADIDVERADCEAATLRKQGLCAEAILLDISDSSSVQSFFSRLDSLDILVNNAGVQQRVCAIADLEDEEWHRMMRVNLSACSIAAGLPRA